MDNYRATSVDRIFAGLFFEKVRFWLFLAVFSRKPDFQSHLKVYFQYGDWSANRAKSLLFHEHWRLALGALF